MGKRGEKREVQEEVETEPYKATSHTSFVRFSASDSTSERGQQSAKDDNAGSQGPHPPEVDYALGDEEEGEYMHAEHTSDNASEQGPQSTKDDNADSQGPHPPGIGYRYGDEGEGKHTPAEGLKAIPPREGAQRQTTRNASIFE